MKIPRYDQEVTPGGEGQEVFSLPGEKRSPHTIPKTGIDVAEAKTGFNRTLFNIGQDMLDAHEYDAVAESEARTFDAYTQLTESFKDPEFIKNTKPEDYEKIYAEGSRAIRDGITRDFRGNRRKSKNHMGRVLDQYHRKGEVKSSALANSRIVETQTLNLYTRLDDIIEKMKVAYNNKDMEAATQLMTQAEKSIAGGRTADLIGATEAKRLGDMMMLKYNEATSLTDINRAYNDSLRLKSTKPLAALIEARFTEPKDDDHLTENERIKYKIKAEKLMRSVENENKTSNYLERAKANAVMANELVLAESEGAGDRAAAHRAIDIAWGENPDQSAAVKFTFDRDLVTNRNKHSGKDWIVNTPIPSVTPAAIKERTKNLEPAMAVPVQTAMVEEAIRKAKALSEDGDPKAYVMRTTMGKKAGYELNAILSDADPDNPSTPTEKEEAYVRYAERMRGIQEQQGAEPADVRMLTNKEAKHHVSVMGSANADDIDQRLKVIELQHGQDEWPTAFNDLVREGLPGSMQVAAALDKPDQLHVRRAILAGAELSDADIHARFPGVGDKKDLRDSIGDTLKFNPEYIAFVNSVNLQGQDRVHDQMIREAYDTITTLAIKYTFDSGSLNEVEKNTKRAVDESYGRLFNYSKYGYRVPKEIDPIEAVDFKVQSIKNSITADDIHPFFYGEEKVEALARDIRDDGYWVNYKDDALELRVRVKNTWVPIRDKNGKYIRFYFKDLGEITDLEKKQIRVKTGASKAVKEFYTSGGGL